ncbi:CehA/McbA family metallohydrolase domain-containing protein [Novipirellula artificiosorum]|nr:hypothetical protein [Novipirellula artificiosorum]
MPIRKTVPAGPSVRNDAIGVVIDRSLELSFPDGNYAFRLTRGPEYRVIRGTFVLERDSLDEHRVELPRMIDMLEAGWTSGDCLVAASPNSLPLRMAAEDLHVAAVLGHVNAKPIAGRDADDPPENTPCWIREDVVQDSGLVFYGVDSVALTERAGNDDAGNDDAGADVSEVGLPAVTRLAQVPRDSEVIHVAVENPFAWPLPVWLASGRVDGMFVFGDWLEIDRQRLSAASGRDPQPPRTDHPTELGRWAERIYWNLLESGLRIPPLAGSGSGRVVNNQAFGSANPVGYNRLYVANPLQRTSNPSGLMVQAVSSQEAWWQAAWKGHSIATNGPMLQATMNGEIPGHVFVAESGELLQLRPEVQLTVRDPVDYLEVICNGRVHYSARLDEFAKAGGVIPPLQLEESSWVIVRVATLYEDHFRAAMSAPWYVEFNGRGRITSEAVEFFQDWLREYELRLRKLPADELAVQVPFVRAARSFWQAQAAKVRYHDDDREF